MSEESLEDQLRREAQANAPLYPVSVAATLANMHPQTLRQYDRLGLVTPARTRGGGRRYSQRDVATLLEIQQLSQNEGVNLAGIERIIALQREVEQLRATNIALLARLGAQNRVFATGSDGQAQEMVLGQRAARARAMVSMRSTGAMVLWRG